jgi:hypothetical protein
MVRRRLFLARLARSLEKFQEEIMDTFDLSSISENDQIAAEMTRRAGVVAKFYSAMVEGGLPTDLAGTIVVEWARASLQPIGTPSCGCDCDVCRGEAG